MLKAPIKWLLVCQALLLWVLGCVPATAQIEEQDPASQNPREEPVLVEVTKIWDRAPYNSFTDLIRFGGKWYCVFREGEKHVYGEDGKIRVIVSDDGRSWESAALLAEEGKDLRDPKLAVTPDGRLMIAFGGSVYEGETNTSRQSYVTFSEDGQSWTPLHPVLAKGEWLWDVVWHDSLAYGSAYDVFDEGWTLKLYTSKDGLDFQPLTQLQVPDKPNETALSFLSDGKMIALARREAGNQQAWIGTSRAPYTDWSWNETKYIVGGPNFIILPNGQMWAAGRSHVGGPTKTVLARFGLDTYEPVLTLPSGGDTSYPGLVWHDGLLWVSYYSSHEGKASIYLAKVKLPR